MKCESPTAEPLRVAFDAYMRCFVHETRVLRKSRVKRGHLAMVPDPESELRRIVDSVEEGPEFQALVESTSAALTDDYHRAKPGARWRVAVRNVLRRSGAYFSAATGSVPKNVLANFERAFKQREVKVEVLAPLEFIAFSHPENRLDCGQFELRGFSRLELDELLQTRVNNLFYRYAAVDTARLRRYWFLVSKEHRAAPAVSSRITIDLSQVGSVAPSYRSLPMSIDRAIRSLSLFDWEAAEKRVDDLSSGWVRFGIPFVIQVDDALLDSPRGAPDCSGLETETQIFGEDEFEVPAVYAELSSEATLNLTQFCREISEALKVHPENHPWHFFEIAMTYFVRAFRTEGLDQLIWHMVALEALVGGEPVRRTLRHRLSAILASNTQDRKRLKKQFDELYDLRCDLVHGNRLVRSLPGARLHELRQLARGAVLWFARWLAQVQGAQPEQHAPEAFPTRTQLLSALDLDETDRQRIGDILRSLPEGFPRVRGWIG